MPLSAIQTYLTTNNLNCVTWIDGTDTSRISTTGSTFTVLNKLGNTAYDFIQTNPSLHPTSTGKGLKFANNQHIYLRDMSTMYGLFSTNTYTMLFITKGNPFITQDLLSISKINPLLPRFLEITHSSGSSSKIFSNLNVKEYVESSNFNGAYQYLAISQDIKLGISQTSVNKNVYDTQVDINKGFVTNNFPSIVMLGNNNSSVPYTGELNHFLLFFPAISDTHVNNIFNILQSLDPVSLKSSKDYIYNNASIINLDSTCVLTPTLGYTLPIQTFRYNNSCKIDLALTISLSIYTTWNTLETFNWDSLEAEWDFLE